LSAELAVFAQQYKRKAQRGVEPNDRGYSREAEELMKRLSPDELSAVLNAEHDDVVPTPRPKKFLPNDDLPNKKGRGFQASSSVVR
jgi:hypothetical protein